MASTYGLTDAGFIMPTYDNLVSSYTTSFQSSFGSDVATTEDSVIGMLIRILAYTDYTLWEATQGVYNSQTIDGAEGVYLDDIMSQRGLFRKSASGGSGYACVKTSSKASWTTEIDTDTYFNGDNGLFYYVTTDTQLQSSVTAYTITKAQATNAATTITFYIRNVSDGSTNSVSLTTASSTFLTDLQTFIIDNIATEDSSLVTVSGSTLYVGFDSTDYTSPVGLTTSTKFYASYSVGNKWSLIPVKCSTAGYYPLAAGGITGISSAFTGFQSVTSLTDFSAGTEVETDAELRSRFNDELDEASAATRPAIIKALLDTDGVTKVRIYDNPTLTDTDESPACTFTTIISGGESTDIASTLYATKPINTLTAGTTSVTVATEDGGTEVISFTYATSGTYSLKLSYATASGRELTSTEQADIVDKLTTLEAYFEIGSNITNDQIKGVIYSALDFGRLTSLTVYVKLKSEADSYYSVSDINPGYSTMPSFDLDNISYEYITG